MAKTSHIAERFDSIRLRQYPYPYRAMLALCSDLDETPDADTYVSISQYLNSDQNTRHGRGVNLEIGNTLYFNMPKHDLSYWNEAKDCRGILRRLIKSGHIDCIHSYGDSATTRNDARRCLDELASLDCNLHVWVDHAVAATNFGADIMCGHGDIPADDAYHADLTLEYGIRYVWRGRVTSVIGQNASFRPLGVLRRDMLLRSGATAAKDIAKHVLSGRGDGKFSMHRGNRLLRHTTLRDGQSVVEFMRCNPNPGGISVGDHSQGIAEALNRIVLDELVSCGGASVIYTHLGKRLDQHKAFFPATTEAFRRLAGYSQDKKILVATTYRLLRYIESVQSAKLLIRDVGSRRCVDVTLPDYCDPAGLTFYANDHELGVSVNGKEVKHLIRNPPDETGNPSFSIGWRKLEWQL